ncbi:hypothetical protein RY27_27730 [Litorilinea aerophila]|nr:hypothetical protein RY27_27730 [Litorilinea aerophila]
MYPMIPFGPFSLPTGPILALVAGVFGLEVAARYGRRLGLDPNQVWNTGLTALVAGLIVARLWNVFQFWPVYRSEPWLILSLRPGGFHLWAGLAAALVGGYLYMLRHALDPAPMAAAFSVGMVAGGVFQALSGFLTGSVVGTLSDGPWALPYFGELRHPVGLYRAGGLLLLWLLLYLPRRTQPSPFRVVLMALFGYSLLRLFTDAFVEYAALVGSFRLSQILALATALVTSLLLARGSRAVDYTALAGEGDSPAV